MLAREMIVKKKKLQVTNRKKTNDGKKRNVLEQ